MIEAFRNWRFACVLLVLMALLCIILVTSDHVPPTQLKTTFVLATPTVAARVSEKNVGIWTATRGLTAAQNAEAHFRKHNRDFHFTSVDEYVAAATHFLHHPSKDVQTKRGSNGDTMRFRAATGEFAVMRADGTPRTYFKLDPDIHGYPTNQAYFDAQQ